MHFDEYDRRYHAAYGELANVLKLLPKKAIGTTAKPPPRSPSRAARNRAASLKAKLEQGNCSPPMLSNRKSGTWLDCGRLIFYTNTDVKFGSLNPRLIPENFEEHWHASRVHYPTDQNARLRYQAIHYTVSLYPSALLCQKTPPSAGCDARSRF